MADQNQTKSPSGAFADPAKMDVEVAHWEVVKKTKEGHIFEILEGGKDIPTVCIKRVPDIADEKSYAMDIPLKEK